MFFEPAPLRDAWVVTLDARCDERGYFARTFCREEFEAHGIDSTIAQMNTSFSVKEGTLRGIHYQADPHAEPKIVRKILPKCILPWHRIRREVTWWANLMPLNASGDCVMMILSCKSSGRFPLR